MVTRKAFEADREDGRAARVPDPPNAFLVPQHRGMELEEFEAMTVDEDEPRRAAPEVDQLLEQAGIDAIPNTAARSAVLAAMRKAAESWLDGVTDQKRRRHYGQAADLVAACAGCDPSTDTARSVAALRAEHRRFPALRAELDRALEAS